MVSHVLKELLDVVRAISVQHCEVDMHDNLFEIVFFLLPLQLVARCLIRSKVLVEGQNGQVLEIIQLHIVS